MTGDEAVRRPRPAEGTSAMPEEDRAPQFWVNRQVDQRIEELRRSTESAWTELRVQIRRGDGQENTLRILEERHKDLRERIDALEKAVREDLVTQSDFRPYRNGFVAALTAIGLAVLGAVLNGVIVKH